MKKTHKITSIVLAAALMAGCAQGAADTNSASLSSSASASSSMIQSSSVSSQEAANTSSDATDFRQEEQNSSAASQEPADVSSSDAIDSRQEEQSSSAASQEPADTSSDATDSGQGEQSSSGDTPPQTENIIQFYDSFRDIPFVDIDYGVYKDGSLDKNSLRKNGRSWVAAPGRMKFGERCFTDGITVWIIVYSSPGYDDSFDWAQLCTLHGPAGSIWIWSAEPREFDEYPTENKWFTHAEGYTLYTDDGFAFTTVPCTCSKAS